MTHIHVNTELCIKNPQSFFNFDNVFWQHTQKATRYPLSHHVRGASIAYQLYNPAYRGHDFFVNLCAPAPTLSLHMQEIKSIFITKKYKIMSDQT